jgi:hypothetical protein
MVNHLSKNKNILWYIDSINSIGQNFIFNGWMFHTEFEIKNIQIANETIKFKQFPRLDVKDVYNTLKNPNNAGIQIEIHKDKIKESIQLELSNGETVEIESLEKFYIYYSGFNKNQNKSIIVIDDFYTNPDEIREFAINSLTYNESGYHKGKRSTDKFILRGTKEIFERILGKEIYNWNKETYANGVFQFCTEEDPIVYHTDTQNYAGIVFLSPDAPVSTGTATYKSKITGVRKIDETNYTDELYKKTFSGYGDELNFYDNSSYDLVDKVGNVYNRLVLFDSKCIHAATEYYGNDIKDSRFFQLFFFDIK